MKTGIVDDSGFMRLVLKKIISKNSELEFVWDASDGIEAIDKNVSNPADLIISDMEMPRMDGLELLKNLKANNSNTECIIVSGQHESSAPKILEAIRVGAVGFVSKNDDTGQSNLDTMGKALNDLTKFIIKKIETEKINKDIKKINSCLKRIKKFKPRVQIGFNRRYDVGHHSLKQHLKQKIGRLEKKMQEMKNSCKPLTINDLGRPGLRKSLVEKDLRKNLSMHKKTPPVSRWGFVFVPYLENGGFFLGYAAPTSSSTVACETSSVFSSS